MPGDPTDLRCPGDVLHPGHEVVGRFCGVSLAEGTWDEFVGSGPEQLLSRAFVGLPLTRTQPLVAVQIRRGVPHWVVLRASSRCGLSVRRSWRVSYHAAPAGRGLAGRVNVDVRKTFSFLSPALSELAGLLLSTEAFIELLQEVAELAVRIVEPVVTCGITLAQQDRVFTVAAADELASQLDEQQYELDTGPCLQALAGGEVVDVPDLGVESRWDGYPTMAMGRGILGVHSVPLIVAGKPVGVLNLYAATPHAFGVVDRQLAALLAGQAALAVTAALRHYDEVTLSDHLRIALSSRSVIDQAMGIVMAQQRGTPEQAFAALRTISQRRNIKLRVVAAELVETTSRSEPATNTEPASF
jgi:hypothetical protein